MARKPPLRRLSLFLLKPEVEAWKAALRESADVDAVVDLKQEVGLIGVLALKASGRRSPWWVDYLSSHIEEPGMLSGLINASTGALVLFEVGDRRFAAAFGYGRHLLEPESYVHDFGLKVVLNVVEPALLKSVDAKTVDELTLHTRLDVSRASSFQTFGLDASRDLVRSVTGQPRDETLAHRVTGSDVLAVVSRTALPELPALARRLLAAYDADDYKENFAWVDQLRPVKDPALVQELDQRLTEDMQARELTDMHLAPPEVLDWERLPMFSFSQSGDEDSLETDPKISVYREYFETEEDITIERLKRDRVWAFGAEGEGPIANWSVYRCLVYETRQTDPLYVLSAGQWYSVAPSFADEVAQELEQLPELHLDLPDAELGMEEGDYNESAAAATGTLCLDRKLVRVTGLDPIELCDLLSSEKQFVHVKRRGSSSTLSHLFSQGTVIAQLLASDGNFRAAAREVVRGVDAGFEAAVPSARPQADECEIGFVVVTRSTRTSPLSLPFFSQVNLRGAARQIRGLGFKVAVKRVPEG